jgi:hypothetical protein
VAEARSPELVRSEIAVERQHLAEAVDELRRRVSDATDVQRRLGSRLAVSTPAVFAAAFVVSGGIGATMRYFARRGRER